MTNEPTSERAEDEDDDGDLGGIIRFIYLAGAAALIWIGVWTSGLYGARYTATHPKPNQGVALVAIGAAMAMVYILGDAWKTVAKHRGQSGR